MKLPVGYKPRPIRNVLISILPTGNGHFIHKRRNESEPFKVTRPRGPNKPLPVLDQVKVKLIHVNNFITTT